MQLRKSRLLLAGVIAGLGLLGGSSCGDGGGDTVPTPLYRGHASDENYASLQDALKANPDPPTDPERSVTLDSPADGAQVSAGQPPMFSWTNPDINIPDETGGCANDPPGAIIAGGLTTKHCPEVTGYVYWLRFDLPDHPEFDGVLTTNTTWDPSVSDADVWAKITEKSGPVKLTILTTLFINNVIMPGGGPVATYVTLNVQ